MKRGPDLDIEGILDDLSSDRDVRPGGDPDDFDVLQEDAGTGPGPDGGALGGDDEALEDTDDEPGEVSA